MDLESTEFTNFSTPHPGRPLWSVTRTVGRAPDRGLRHPPVRVAFGGPPDCVALGGPGTRRACWHGSSLGWQGSNLHIMVPKTIALPIWLHPPPRVARGVAGSGAPPPCPGLAATSDPVTIKSRSLARWALVAYRPLGGGRAGGVMKTPTPGRNRTYTTRL